jgi:O-antigen biosynthesis protein WbqP
MLLIAIAIRLDSPGPALFRQRRAGRGSSEFRIYKFRTMRQGTPDLATHLLGSSKGHVTRLGRLLRRTSLDELPQLLNIAVGEMSLVGPRPALWNQDDLIAMRRAAKVDGLRPGLTGLAQIRGRDELDLDEKVAYDRTYLETCSLRVDLAIVVGTIAALSSSRGIS